MHAAALAAAAPPETSEGGLAPAASSAEANMRLRLIHDLRRLKDIKSIDAKIAAKREMLPAYRDWCAGLIAAAATTGEGVQEEILPTVMIWSIDVGDYAQAIELAEHVLLHKIQLPPRYNRDAATLVTEEVAEAALKAGDAGFPIDILDAVDDLVAGIDMHDQVRAKFNKAVGVELHRLADAEPDAPDIGRTRVRALAALREAHRLDVKAGVKGRITAIEKLIGKAPIAEPATATETPAPVIPDDGIDPNLAGWIAAARGSADGAA
nr:phage terminase small subunit [Sphingomonas bacterium]